MPTNFCQRTAMAAAIAACFPGLAGAQVARVDFATGSVSATAPDGRSRTLTKGSEIAVGETIATQQGRAQLRFADGALMSLQPQTEFKVEEFKYSGKADPGDNIVMNLLKGGMRTITGLIGRTNRNAYRLRTDVATIGIRGTEYSVRYTNSIEVNCTDGAVSVDNQSGSFVVTGGTTVMVQNQNTAPQTTDQKPVLPPESPTQEQQEEQQQRTQDPVNPVQEKSPTVPLLLTGTITGNWAASHPNFSHTRDSNRTVTLDGTGTLVSYDGFEGVTTVGTATGISSGNDGVIAWGRWANGTTGGVSPHSGQDTTTPSELHYVVGIAPATMPASGTATYSMIGATPPSSFESVTVVSSSLTVNFGTGSGAMHAQFVWNGSNVGTMPGGASLSVSGSTFNGGGCMAGPFCTQNINFSGIFAGDQASRAGLAYTLNVNGSGAHGAIAYSK